MRNICFLMILSLSRVFAQSEQLDPSSASSASVGKNRTAEFIGASVESPIPTATLDSLSRFVVANDATDQEINSRLSAIATLYPGHNYVNVTVRRADGTVKYSDTTHNLRTNAGANWQADIMANTSTPSVNTQCNYIAMTNDSTTPVVGGTTLTSEIAANGLTRAQGTYAHSANATSYTVAKTFTASGTQAFQQSAVFTASSSGTMCFWATVTSGTVNNTDTLTVTWTVNF